MNTTKTRSFNVKAGIIIPVMVILVATALLLAGCGAAAMAAPEAEAEAAAPETLPAADVVAPEDAPVLRSDPAYVAYAKAVQDTSLCPELSYVHETELAYDQPHMRCCNESLSQSVAYRKPGDDEMEWELSLISTATRGDRNHGHDCFRTEHSELYIHDGKAYANGDEFELEDGEFYKELAFTLIAQDLLSKDSGISVKQAGGDTEITTLTDLSFLNCGADEQEEDSESLAFARAAFLPFSLAFAIDPYNWDLGYKKTVATLDKDGHLKEQRTVVTASEKGETLSLTWRENYRNIKESGVTVARPGM
jgi:hypothetical protein